MDDRRLDSVEMSIDALGDRAGLDIGANALRFLLALSPTAETWQMAEPAILDLLGRSRQDPAARARIVKRAALVPLESVRQYVQRVADDETDPGAGAARRSLARLGDTENINRLIQSLRAHPENQSVAKSLAQAPLESVDCDTESLAGAVALMDRDDPGEASSYLWAALALGRRGRIGPLQKAVRSLGEGWEPSVLWGNPANFAADLHAMRPVPVGLTEVLTEESRTLPWLTATLRGRSREPAIATRLMLKALTEIPESAAPAEDVPLDRGVVQRALADFALPGGVTIDLDEDAPLNEQTLSRLTADAFTASLSRYAAGNAPADGLPIEVTVGNPFMTLIAELPRHEPDADAIVRAYGEFTSAGGDRSADFEAQIGWLLSRCAAERRLAGLDPLLRADSPSLRAVGWSLLRRATEQEGSTAMPFFGAGGDAGSADDARFRAARSTPLIPSAGGWETAEPPQDEPASPGEGGSGEPGQAEGSGGAGDGAPTGSRGGPPPPGGAEPDVPKRSGPPPPPDAPDAPGQDPPRSAYGLLACADRVRPMKYFPVTVGLSAKKRAGTTAQPIRRPASSRGPYWLKIRLTHDGFELEPDALPEVHLWVTADTPYPTETIRLRALDDPAFSPTRVIMAEFSVDGHLLGAAARAVTLDDTLDTDATEAQAAGVSAVVPPADTAPDMTLTIARGNRADDYRLIWNVETIHDAIDVVTPRDEDLSMDLGGQPEEWTREMMNRVNMKEGEPDLQFVLQDAGERIAAKIPVWVQKKLIELRRTVTDRPPTVLLVSAEPNIPWELARLPLRDSGYQFLSMEFVVGRWVLGPIDARTDRPRPPLPPPVDVNVDSMTVISGDYSNTRGWKRLEGAEEEAAYLRDTYGASPIDANMADLLAWLTSAPEARAIHFCVHGKWDTTGIRDGIALVDGNMLDPAVVRQNPLPGHPFVFLNACQVGQGDQILGNYGGMAEAFLTAGASAVIAPLWSVDDKAAKAIATRFYEHLADRDAAGELLREEKLNFNEQPTSGTFLAYQFFGHPRMRMKLNLTPGARPHD